MTFESHLAGYAQELTGQRSLRPTVLINRCTSRSHAREACLFYLVSKGKAEQALELASNQPFYVEWSQVVNTLDGAVTFDECWQKRDLLPARYEKVLLDYHAKLNRPARLIRIKAAVRDRIAAQVENAGISLRDLAKCAEVDHANLSAFVNKGDYGRLSLSAIERVVAALQTRG